MTANRELRIATLIVAPLLAAVSTLSARDESLLHRAAPALVILWMIMMCAIVLRPDRSPRDGGDNQVLSAPVGCLRGLWRSTR